MLKFLVALISMTTAIASLQAAAVEGKVIKYPLNVRAGAGTQYTALVQLDKNTPVKITAVSDQWLAIEPPAGSRVWVAARYIKNNQLTANINFRSGPSTGYEALGLGRKGMKVETHGKATPSGWIAVSAPDNLQFYVGRPAVEAEAEALKKLPRFKAPDGRPLPNKELIKLEGNFVSSGKDVTLTGYIYASEDNIKAITHVLYQPQGDELLPKYFLMPNRADLKKFDGKKVKLHGESYKVKNWSMPIVIVKNVSNAE